MDARLEQILKLPNVWQASRMRRPQGVLPTGYRPLDRQLHDGGWPNDATTELLLPHPGIGELRLLLPALRRAQYQRPWLVLIAPPYPPYASAWYQQGIQPQGLLVIEPESKRDLLWSAEQVLASGCCAAALTWATGISLNTHQLRRLQQAAHRGQCWHSLFRSPQAARQPSPSALRLALSCSREGLLQLHLLKQRGGWSGQRLSLMLEPDMTQLQRLAPEQLPIGRHQHSNRPGDTVEPADGSKPSGRIISLR